MSTFLDVMGGVLGQGMINMADAYADMKRMEELKNEYNTLAQKYGKETIGNTSTTDTELPEPMKFNGFCRADSFLEAAGYSYVKRGTWKKGDILVQGEYMGNRDYLVTFYKM